MLSDLIKHPDFIALIDEMRADLVADILAADTEDEARAEALRKYHLIDDLEVKLGVK